MLCYSRTPRKTVKSVGKASLLLPLACLPACLPAGLPACPPDIHGGTTVIRRLFDAFATVIRRYDGYSTVIRRFRLFDGYSTVSTVIRRLFDGYSTVIRRFRCCFDVCTTVIRRFCANRAKTGSKYKWGFLT